MIYKRFQTRTKTGITWTNWFKYSGVETDINILRKKEKYQYGKTLLNEFKDE